MAQGTSNVAIGNIERPIDRDAVINRLRKRGKSLPSSSQISGSYAIRVAFLVRISLNVKV